MTNSNGLYLHIPFCRSKCIYCDFLSFAGSAEQMEVYVDALIAEMQLYAPRCKDRIFDTVYIGGGTPGVLPPFLLHKIFEGMRNSFCISGNAEITIEINPASSTAQKAEEFAKCGINRVSIGLQSINDSQLKVLGRRHTMQDFVNTVKLIQAAGIHNISADLLLGLPNQTEAEITQAIELFDTLNLTHASAYGLKVERGTPLSRLVKNKKIILPDDDKAVELYDFAVAELSKSRFRRYEVSNFCRDNYHSRHNLNCWQCQDYLGLGLAAHSCIFGKRFSNGRMFKSYTEKVLNGQFAVTQSQRLTLQDRIAERIMLGLRLEEGIDIIGLNADFGIDFVEKNSNVQKFLQQGCLLLEDGMLKINSNSFYIMNSLLAQIL